MDEFRGKPFIDLPNWQNDLLDELLGDPEMNKPKSEKEAPEFYKTVPKGEKGQGKKDVESQSGTPSEAASDADSVLTSPQ